MAITGQATFGDQGGAPAKIQNGNARLPDGRKIDDVKVGELHRLLANAGVPGVDAPAGTV